MDSYQLKNVLYQRCLDFVKNQEETITKTIQSNQQALMSETKSSAGDKHETGRAMIQLEMEKASQQLEGIHVMKIVMAKVDVYTRSKLIRLGSLVLTDQAHYFLAISVGEIKIKDKLYYAISPSSPIGKLLLGKKVGDKLVFNGKTIVIDTIY